MNSNPTTGCRFGAMRVSLEKCTRRAGGQTICPRGGAKRPSATGWHNFLCRKTDQLPGQAPLTRCNDDRLLHLTLCIVSGLIATGLLFALALCRAAADTRVRPDGGMMPKPFPMGGKSRRRQKSGGGSVTYRQLIEPFSAAARVLASRRLKSNRDGQRQ